jgi:hypothetical protein
MRSGMDIYPKECCATTAASSLPCRKYELNIEKQEP